jgi:hypothetical protein
MANYIVSGAGSGGNFNGVFIFASGYLYENSVDPNYAVDYDSGLSQWVIRHFSDVYYYNTTSSETPPLSGWLVSLGLPLAPTITMIPPKNIFNTKNLFLKSAFENSVSLYIKSSVFNANLLSLYLEAHTQEQTELYIKSFPQSSINLFIKYWYEYQDSQELYIKAFMESSKNLYISSLATPLANTNIDFNIYGSTIDTQINVVDLYISSITQQNFDLFLKVNNIGNSTNFISLFIDGNFENLKKFESLNLYLSNEYKSVYNSLNITIIGLGTTFNGIPNNSSVNMFIQRNIEATWNSVPLIAYGASSAITSSIDFNIYTKDTYFDSIELVIPEINQPFNGNVELYTHGFED